MSGMYAVMPVLLEKNWVPVYKFLKTPLIRKYGEEFYNVLSGAADEWKKEYGS
jgi:hypothetical protein